MKIYPVIDDLGRFVHSRHCNVKYQSMINRLESDYITHTKYKSQCFMSISQSQIYIISMHNPVSTSQFLKDAF